MHIRAAFALLLTVTGCTTTHYIPKSELRNLDGWKGEETTLLQDIGSTLRNEPKDIRRLRDTDGTQHPFSVDTPLVLVPFEGDDIVEKYVEVHVDGQSFRGVPRSAFRGNVEVPLDKLESAGVRKFSLGKTLLLGAGIGASLTAALIVLGLAVGGGSGDGGDIFDDSLPCGHGCSF